MHSQERCIPGVRTAKDSGIYYRLHGVWKDGSTYSFETKATDTELHGFGVYSAEIFLWSNLSMLTFFPFRMEMYRYILEICNLFFYLTVVYSQKIVLRLKRYFNLETSEQCWDS